MQGGWEWGSREAEINRLWWEEGRGKDRGRIEEAEEGKEGREERRKENSFSVYVQYIHPNQNPIQTFA